MLRRRLYNYRAIVLASFLVGSDPPSRFISGALIGRTCTLFIDISFHRLTPSAGSNQATECRRRSETMNQLIGTYPVHHLFTILSYKQLYCVCLIPISQVIELYCCTTHNKALECVRVLPYKLFFWFPYCYCVMYQVSCVLASAWLI